jgi:imidazolonepropionase-like amidohydrolase
MVTSEAARIAGLEDELGRIAAGRPADITVLERNFEDPWRNVVKTDPSRVELVTIDGFLVYGRAKWMDQVAPHPDIKPIIT